MSDWRPIETAPKDTETKILLVFKEYGRLEVTIAERRDSGRNCFTNLLDWSHYDGCSSDDPVEGLYWMPLPEPPK